MTFVRGNVGDVALAEERQQVVLAQAVEVDVLHDHHLAVIDGEQRVVEDFVDVHAVAAREELEGLLDALRGVQQPFAAGIFSELGQELPYERLHYCRILQAQAQNRTPTEKRNKATGCVIRRELCCRRRRRTAIRAEVSKSQFDRPSPARRERIERLDTVAGIRERSHRLPDRRHVGDAAVVERRRRRSRTAGTD